MSAQPELTHEQMMEIRRKHYLKQPRALRLVTIEGLKRIQEKHPGYKGVDDTLAMAEALLDVEGETQ